MENDIFKHKPWLREITKEDFHSEDLKMIADFAGVEAAISLLLNMRGYTFTIPCKEELILKTRYIKRIYDGSKTCRRKLAKECGVTENYIYKLYNKSESV